jgi:hypothetical protein
MAIVKRNSALEGISGTVGDLVFRVRGDTTIVARKPVRKKRDGPLAPGQEKTVSRFREAVAFAREARTRPAFRSLSRLLRGFSPYHLAIQDFLSEPVIEDVVEESVEPARTILMVTVSERIGVRMLHAKIVESADATPTGPVAEPGIEVMTPEPKVAPKSSTYSTPALMFFKREPAAPPKPVAPPPPPPEPIVPGEPTVTREGETREPREEGAPPVSWTKWRVVVPGSGEVEITAFDYAGNRAVRRVKVGT